MVEFMDKRELVVYYRFLVNFSMLSTGMGVVVFVFGKNTFALFTSLVLLWLNGYWWYKYESVFSDICRTY